jgi:NADH:ubiquinone oxidoreductase subunit 5 (subunit L)/multisubunit Na+/H+ antiporter MnhA subunit
MKATGIILIIVGVLLAAFTSMNFFSKDKIVDAGNLELSKKENHSIYWSPWIGAALIGGGVLFLGFGVYGDRNKNRTSSATVERTTTTSVHESRP